MKGLLKVSTPAEYIAKLIKPRKTEIAGFWPASFVRFRLYVVMPPALRSVAR